MATPELNSMTYPIVSRDAVFVTRTTSIQGESGEVFIPTTLLLSLDKDALLELVKVLQEKLYSSAYYSEVTLTGTLHVNILTP